MIVPMKSRLLRKVLKASTTLVRNEDLIFEWYSGTGRTQGLPGKAYT